MSFHTLFMEMDEGMKKILWIFSILYVAVPGVVVWMAWTGQLVFREGLELETKILLAIALFLASFIANYVAWSNFLRHKKRWEDYEKG